MNRRTYCSSALLTAAGSSLAIQNGMPFSALGLCTSYKNAPVVQASDGSYIEDGVRRLLVPNEPQTVWQKNRDASKSSALPILACNSFLPGSLRSVGKYANHEAVLTYAKTAFQRAEEIGVDTIVFGSSGSRRLKDGDDQITAVKQFVSLLEKMGPLAQEHKLTIAVEPLRRQECNFINTIVDGMEIVEQVQHPNVRLVFDLYHMSQNGESPADLKKAAHLLHHGHIAENEKRTAPGVAGDDFRPFFSVLKEINYSGRLSIEGKWQPEQLANAFQVIRRQVAE